MREHPVSLEPVESWHRLSLQVTGYCPRQCSYCVACSTQWHDPSGIGLERAITEVVALRARAGDGRALVEVTGGEPTLCPWLLDLLPRCHALGLQVCLLTSGACSPVTLAGLAEHCDWIVLSHHADTERHRLLELTELCRRPVVTVVAARPLRPSVAAVAWYRRHGVPAYLSPRITATGSPVLPRTGGERRAFELFDDPLSWRRVRARFRDGSEVEMSATTAIARGWTRWRGATCSSDRSRVVAFTGAALPHWCRSAHGRCTSSHCACGFDLFSAPRTLPALDSLE